jgi:hypothetical protein
MSMRGMVLGLVVSTLAVTACSDAASSSGPSSSGASGGLTGQVFSCDSSWVCLKAVAAKSKYAVMAPAASARVVVPATLDVHSPTASQRVSYVYELPGSDMKITVMGTRGTFFKKAVQSKAYSVQKITIRGLPGERWSTSAAPQTAIVWWGQGGWTWRVSGAGPNVVAALAQQAESLHIVEG